jgi:hypothetical protein
MIKAKPFRVVPKIIFPILAGYSGLYGGLGVSWLGYLLKVIKPINQRFK